MVAIERDAKAKVFSWPVGLSEAKVRSYGAGAIHYGVLSEPNQSENG
jgi:16S rRNA (guanine966-N2)-methyltransferase